MKVIAMVQARFNSSRMPGKVLQQMCGIPMLKRVVDRVAQAQFVDDVIVLTSDQESDDPIADFCQRDGIDFYRGPLNDVLGRYWLAAQYYQADQIIRITADCPLIDAGVIDSVIEMHLQQKNDYTSNCLEYSLPDGLDCEVFNYETLEQLAQQADKLSWREHVTLMLRQGSLKGDHKVACWKSTEDYSGWRLTVDYPQDFSFVEEIYQRFDNSHYVTLSDVITLLNNDSDLRNKMPVIELNEGINESMKNDNQVEVEKDGTVPEIN